MKKDIFISYRREDSSFFAAKLRDRLEQVFPGQIFLDISAISAGEDFVNTLKDSVSASKVVIVVVSRYWHTSSDGKTKLGVNGDFVTEEIGMALELGIPVIPVILDDASMPSVEVLPMRLQGLVRRNAVFISHAHFDSDIDYLINAIYVQLGLKPPTALEKFLEAIPGAKFRFNVRIRDQIAIYSFLSSLLVALFLGIWFVFFRFTDNDNSSVSDVLLSALGYSVLSLLFNIIGLNSSRRYRFALFGTFISLLTLIFASGFGVVGGYFQPQNNLEDPWTIWITAGQLAELYADKSELPAAELSWTKVSPISGPLPQVECGCLKAINNPKGVPPYGSGAVMSIENSCMGQALFLVARWRYQYSLQYFNPWIALRGNDYTAIILSPNQVVNIPLEGTYGAVYYPWQCQK